MNSNTPPINMGKNKIREGLIKENFEIGQDEKVNAEFAICEQLLTLSEIKKAKKIAIYCAIDYEVDLRQFISAMLEENKILCFPRYKNNCNESQKYEMAEICNIDDLKKGKFGILEPSSECKTCCVEKIDTWLIPGVAFDHTGVRLGRGGGVYDRLLNITNGLKIGVLFNAQLKESLPSEKHDIKMDMLITEDRVMTVEHN